MDVLKRLNFGEQRLPLILQTEAAECSLACLGMVACYYRFQTDLPALRARFAMSLKGVSLMQLMRYADQLHFTSRPLRLELNELNQLKTPCILHWNLNHFVVLKKVIGKRVIIHDPSRGVRNLDLHEVSQYFTGVALELTPNVEFKPANEKRRVSVRNLFGKVEGLREALTLVFVMALALELISLISPMFNQWVVDEALVSEDSDLLNVLIFGFTLVLVTQVAISVARGWTVMYLSTQLGLQWSANVFSHLIQLPVSWFEKRHLGDIVSRFGATGAIQQTLTTSFLEAILDGLLAIATLGMMLLYSTKLVAIVLSSVFLYGLLRVLSYAPLREANLESMVLSAKAQSCFMETMRGIQAIKIFGRELDRRTRWLNMVVDSVNRNVRTQKFSLWFGIANTAVFGMQGLLLFWLGAHMVLDHSFTTGMLFAFSSYAGQFTSRTASLIDKFFSFRMLSVQTERLADIVLEDVEKASEITLDPRKLSTEIEFANVSFRYADGEPWIIRNLDLFIKPGESIVIAGASGCGKTTLIKLLLGVLEPTEGEIRYGGMPVSRIGVGTYRQILGAVMQEDQLLTGSLAENISFFDTKPDQKRIELCADLAAIRDDIEAMPMRYFTLVGDMGTSLSGGQKQRILLARALYRQPKVLVLDEATSHLDVERERVVNHSIRAMSITRISVAHRPETIAMAERVVRLHKGVIVQDFVQIAARA